MSKKFLKHKNRLIGLVVVCAGTLLAWQHKARFFAKPLHLFVAECPQRRDISKVVLAEGVLEIDKVTKIGPLITAKVKKIYPSEGDMVKKGDLLAQLDNDKGGDTDVRQMQALLEQAQATADYLSANYQRQRALFEAGEIADDAFEKITETYKRAQADVKNRQAMYDKELFLFEQTRITAPHDGTIIAVNVEEGETVSAGASPPKTLFTLAKDLNAMEASIYIDENKIGDIKVGMKAAITVDTYPDRKPWQSTINFVSFRRTDVGTNAASYKANMVIDNSARLLRSGMTIHAKIIVAQAQQVLAVPGFVFQMSTQALQTAAKILHYRCQPLPESERARLDKKEHDHPARALWVYTGDAFIEKIVHIGVTDNNFFEVIDGIAPTDQIITDDMTASEEVKKLAQKVVSNG